MLLDSATATWRQDRNSKILWERDFCTQPHYRSDGGQNRHLPVCTDLRSKPVQVLRELLCPCKVKEGAMQESRGRGGASLEGAGEAWGRTSRWDKGWGPCGWEPVSQARERSLGHLPCGGRERGGGGSPR